jgi:hypothetical protein
MLATPPTDAPFIHPGALNTQADFDRIRNMVAHKISPWKEGWKRVEENPHGALDYRPHPESVLVRGAGHGVQENYNHLFNDVAAAYQDCLEWKVDGDTEEADKAVQILNAWASTMVQITGTSDKYLASGIYGYQLAVTAEILRTYRGWKPKDFARFQSMMLQIVYPMNHEFLLNHNGAKIDHYWANWDLANIASMLSIGILLDRRDIYREAIDYYLHGAGNGSLQHLVSPLYDGGLGQWQESGRDQGHSTLGVGLAGSICQMAWNQGDDLFAAEDNRLLKGAEYVAKYNLGYDVPYTSYTNSDVTQPIISDKARGDDRPIWELVYNHYVVLKGLKAPYVQQYALHMRPEGGGGDYGPNSGGFDQLGFGTLTFALPLPGK